MRGVSGQYKFPLRNLAVGGSRRTTLFRLNLIFLTLIFVPIYALAGPYEGAQVTTNSNKSDWWGPLAPLTPEFFNLNEERWKWIVFYIATVTLLVILQSKALAVKGNQISSWSNSKLFVFQYFSSLYVLTNGRDGLSYFFVSASFALLIISFSLTHRVIRGLSLLVSLSLLVIGSLFKITIFPIAILLLFLYVLSKSPKKKKVLLAGSSVSLILAIFVLVLNYKLPEKLSLSKSYPEQQVMLYDIANVYCWSQDSESREFAGRILDHFRTGNADNRVLCASAAPYGWDLLRLPWIDWSSNTPLKQVLPGDESSFVFLSNEWGKLIKHFPEEWAESKINHLGQVLFMSNIFYSSFHNLNPSENAVNFLSWLILSPAYFLDSLLLTSLAFAFLSSIVLISRKSQHGLQLLLFQTVSLAISTLTFVANNGRYVFSSLLLSIFLFLSMQGLGQNPKDSDRFLR